MTYEPRIATLHDAARELERIADEVDYVLSEARLLERAHHIAMADAATILEGGLLDEESERAMDEASGWEAYFDVAYRMRDALACVEQGREELHREALQRMYPGSAR